MKPLIANLNLARAHKRISVGLCLGMVALVLMSGCTAQRRKALEFTPDVSPCQSMLQQIEVTDLIDESCTDGSELIAPTPTTISSFANLAPREITVEEAVELALANSKICLLYTSPSPRDATLSRMPSSA